VQRDREKGKMASRERTLKGDTFVKKGFPSNGNGTRERLEQASQSGKRDRGRGWEKRVENAGPPENRTFREGKKNGSTCSGTGGKGRGKR